MKFAARPGLRRHRRPDAQVSDAHAARMARPFTRDEWQSIEAMLDADPERFGFPMRRPGSLLLGSFNIRKLGDASKRRQATWDFLTRVCGQFDLMAIQEVQDDLEGLRRIMQGLGPGFELVVSDATGVFPGRDGMAERLAFIYRSDRVERTEIATDISVDRTAVMTTLIEHHDAIDSALDVFETKMHDYEDKMLEFARGQRSRRPTKPQVQMPTFLTFIRAPFMVSFRVPSASGADPLQFMAVNAHLYYGHYADDRRQEFSALLEWLVQRVRMKDRTYYQDFILLGDLNLDFDNPENDIKRVEKQMKDLDADSPGDMHVNFPFLDAHPGETEVYRTNARLKETFDHVGLFFRDDRFFDHTVNDTAGTSVTGPDYGVFNFVRLFSEALRGQTIDPPERGATVSDEESDFIDRFDDEVSDHLPIWIRIPAP